MLGLGYHTCAEALSSTPFLFSKDEQQRLDNSIWYELHLSREGWDGPGQWRIFSCRKKHLNYLERKFFFSPPE